MMIILLLLIIIIINAPLSSCHGIPSCPVCVTLIPRRRGGEGVWTKSSTIHCTYHRSIPNLLSHDLRPIKASARQPRVIAPNMRIMNEYIIIYYITYILYYHKRKRAPYRVRRLKPLRRTPRNANVYNGAFR